MLEGGREGNSSVVEGVDSKTEWRGGEWERNRVEDHKREWSMGGGGGWG